ncbi:Ras-related protein Rab-13, partial [Geodia barretti]
MQDTAGIERFRTITSSYYRGATGIILVYDVTCQHPFDNLQRWLREIEENVSCEVKIALIGNKCEMEAKRVVTREMGEEF